MLLRVPIRQGACGQCDEQKGNGQARHSAGLHRLCLD